MPTTLIQKNMENGKNSQLKALHMPNIYFYFFTILLNNKNTLFLIHINSLVNN